jgi:Tfp pilus assembly protein PilP
MRLALALTFMLTLSAPVAAQSVPATTVPPASQTTPKADEPSGYTYNADGRRDPFVSLLRRAADVQRSPAGIRPAGLAGLTTAEVVLKGIMTAQDGYHGILLGADQKSYIVRSGDRLLDGTVRAIAADSLVIVQQMNDPLSPQKQREIRKMLHQSEEAK